MNTSAGESSFGYHRLITLADCQRKYGGRYGLRLEPHRMADAPALGSLLHLASMHHYRAIAGLDALDPLGAMRIAPARIAHQYTKASEIWPRYVEWARTEDAVFDQVLDVEREYEAKVGGRRITARLDLVTRVGSEVRVYDHKSTSGDLASEIKAQAGKGQIAFEDVIGQAILPAMYGLAWGGVWINAISTSARDPVALRGRARVPEAWRGTVVEALGGLLEEAERIEAREGWGTDAGFFSLPVNPEACQGRFQHGRCDYYEICRGGPAQMRTAFFNFDRGVDEVSILREGAGR